MALPTCLPTYSTYPLPRVAVCLSHCVFSVSNVCVCVDSCVNLHNQQHVLVMCAVAFYMMENYPLDVGADFTAGVIQVRAQCV